MAKLGPKKALERLETIENALRQETPAASFGGITAAAYATQVEKSRAARTIIDDLENQLKTANNNRDDIDAEGLRQAQLIINGVIGDKNHGPDSPLYETMGFVRRSERKSGLKRKGDTTLPKT